MAITLTLTDDQALEIVSQISGLLANRPAPRKQYTKVFHEKPVTSVEHYTGKTVLAKNRHLTNASLSISDRVKMYIDDIPIGIEFPSNAIWADLGLNYGRKGSVSGALYKIKESGAIQMIRRGWWKRVG